MKEILIINLTRMGDLLQTTPLMAGLKKLHPGARLTLLANSSFSEVCRRIPFIDDLLLFDMKHYRERLTGRKYSLVENYRFLESLINEINTKKYDLLINVTHSPISALITSLVQADEVRGFTVDSEGHRMIRHPWMRYFFNVIPNRNINPFHLVDMYVRIAEKSAGHKGLFFSLTDDDEKKAGLLLAGEGIKEGETLVGIHLGASKNDKTWPVESYARLAEKISRSLGARIFVFGSKEESVLVNEFMSSADANCINFAGRTGLGELAALLKKCVLFITNDTGPLHIATSVGTRVIDISAANVHFMETGPYGEGHYVIQAQLPCVPCGFDVVCRKPVCKSLITPEAVFEIVKDSIHDGKVEYDGPAGLWKDIQVYRSYFKDDGFLAYYPLIKRVPDRDSFYRILYRNIWDLGAEADAEGIKRIFSDVAVEISSFYDVKGMIKLIPSLKDEYNALGVIAEMAGKGADLTAQISLEAERDTLDINSIREVWSRVEDTDREIELAGNTYPCLRIFTEIFRFAKEAMDGDGLRELANDCQRIYRDLQVNSSNMLKLLGLFIRPDEMMNFNNKGGLHSCEMQRHEYKEQFS